MPAAVAAIDVVCPGTPWEMGHAQGAALGDRIHAARAALAGLQAFRLRQPRWLPYPVYRALAGRKAHRVLAGPLARDCPAMADRLAGLAAGARLSPPAVYLFNALEPLLSSVAGCTACPAACSAVAVHGRRSASGEPMIAHNFDYLPLAQPFYTLREDRPRTGARAIAFTTAPLAGAIDGLNEHGLCITYNYAFTTDQGAGPTAPLSMRIAEALQQCRTVTEAARWIADRPRWGAGLLMLADAGGDIASLEVSNTRSHLRRLRPGEDVLFHTNNFASDVMRAVQIADDAVYTDAAPAPLRGRRLHLSSERRNGRFRKRLAERLVLDADELGAVMADHGEGGVPDDFTPCVHGTYWYTTACLQFFPRSRRLRVAYSAACQARYTDMGI